MFEVDLDRARTRLVESLKKHIRDERVLKVMTRLPRERFVSPDFRHAAYSDEPLPIGCNQTISQPLIIAMMTEALELTGNEKVLEIGTGSGYQTAILAELSLEVVSTERIPDLANKARDNLQKLGYTNVTIHLTEKSLGWVADAPYARIIVTAAAPRVPSELLDQLSVGGIMVIPVGDRNLQE